MSNIAVVTITSLNLKYYFLFVTIYLQRQLFLLTYESASCASNVVNNMHQLNSFYRADNAVLMRV